MSALLPTMTASSTAGVEIAYRTVLAEIGDVLLGRIPVATPSVLLAAAALWIITGAPVVRSNLANVLMSTMSLAILCAAVALAAIGLRSGVAGDTTVEEADPAGTAQALEEHYGVEVRGELPLDDGADVTLMTDDGMVDGRIAIDEARVRLFVPQTPSTYIELPTAPGRTEDS